MIHLSVDELGVLLESLRCWENDPGQGALLGALMGLMLSPPEKRDAAKDEFLRDAQAAKVEAAAREDRAAILRGKLVAERMRIQKLSAAQAAAEEKEGWHVAGGG